MKRIEFIAPVEAMRGNLSGSQVLSYGGGKRAYNVSDAGSVAAENYDSRYIGSKRLRNGKKFFSLKSKSTTALGAASRLAMAAFGGACSVARAAFKTLTIITSLQTIFDHLREDGKIKAFETQPNWLQTVVYPMLKNKQASVTVTDGRSTPSTVTINNPWISGGAGTDVNIPADVLAKFNAVLSA